ncbi:hypothetical protein ACFPER_11775 [Agromyces aurantiacus]|uniref:Uncharacterized protein n=1 Tax=Agromyces aurantiacus TaxID=165814 RepID=A0ABV9R692_9MICO|nr:hypothetical protein [Agromyces aurantiacus]MBM7504159.1 hypothetical protein [Agromyces aurantiacus]
MSGFENPEVRPARVIVLSPNGLYDEQSIPGLRRGDSVQVITFERVAQTESIVLTRPMGFVDRLARRVSRSGLGRELLRLTALDAGVRFHRAARQDERVARALDEAQLVVAPERDGALAAWHASRAARRRGRATTTVFGYPAARAALERARS